MEEDALESTEEYIYVIVAPNGMGGSGYDFNSWQNQGSNTGFDSTGLIPVCDVTQDFLDYCDESCQPCDIRCYWSHCKDKIITIKRKIRTECTEGNILFLPAEIFLVVISF